MKKVSLDKLSSKELIDHSALSTAFTSYLMQVLGYSKPEAEFVSSTDFKDPYDAPFVLQEYEGRFSIDGNSFEVRACHTDFCACGPFHLSNAEPFEFYMFIELNTLKDRTVGSYRKANKLYLL